VPEASQADDAQVVAGFDAVILEGAVAGDASTQQRRGGGDVHLLRHANHEGLVDDDVGGVPAHRHAARDLVLWLLGAIGADESSRTRAELLVAVLALWARAAGVDHAADTRGVTDLELCDLCTDGHHLSEDLVANAERV
jgi:hypothetical protein